MTALSMTTNEIDYEAIKTKQNAAWSSGDYAKVGTTLQITGENLAESMNLRPGAKVLDVAAGNGNATLAFARRWAQVTSTDYVDHLLAKSRRRAEAEGFDIRYQIADAENLPFENEEFDAVVSTFGVMFTPNQNQAAFELLRTCRQGGKIGLANWTPESFIGQLFKVLGQYITPPAGVSSPALWGNENWINQQFANDAKDISVTKKNFNFRYQSPEHFIDVFRNFYGPVHKAYAALDENKQNALTQDLVQAIEKFNTSQQGDMCVPGEYAEIIIVKA